MRKFKYKFEDIIFQNINNLEIKTSYCVMYTKGGNYTPIGAKVREL